MKQKLLALLTILVLVGMLTGAALASPVASDGSDDDPPWFRKTTTGLTRLPASS